MTCVYARGRTPTAVFEVLAAAEVSYLWLVTTYLRRLLAVGSDRSVRPGLRDLSLVAEPVTWDDLALVRARLAPGCAIRHSYGASEVGDIAEHWVEPDEPLGDGLVQVGRPGAAPRDARPKERH